MAFEADFVEPNRRATRIDGIKQAITALQLLRNITQCKAFAIIILTIGNHHDHMARAGFSSFANIFCGIPYRIKKRCAILRAN